MGKRAKKMEGMRHWPRTLWKILGSRRLAEILLASLLLVLLLVSLFPPMPAEPASQEMWLEAVNLRYGPATGLLKKLGVFEAYRSGWFLVLLTALLLNTLICTFQRLPRLWHSLTALPVIHRPEAFYQGFALHAEWTMASPDQGLSAVWDILLQHRLRPQIERDETTGGASLYAERGRWSQAGTLVSHFAAVLLVLAVACRPALGWQESGLIFLPGEVYRIGHGYDLDVRAGRPVIEQQLDVPLAILTDTSAITQTVRINQPLAWRGVAFHLQSYGPAVQITAPEGTFGAAFSDSQAQQVALPEAGLVLRVAHRPAEGDLFVEALAADGALLGSGSVPHGQEIEIQGIPVTFSLTNYTVWQVSHDPTFGLAVASAVLLLAAIVISLWVPHRRLWFRVGAEGQAQMAGVGHREEEFDAIATEIAHTCCLQGERDG
jgi:cytochrome c biogenesis protein ResB